MRRASKWNRNEWLRRVDEAETDRLAAVVVPHGDGDSRDEELIRLEELYRYEIDESGGDFDPHRWYGFEGLGIDDDCDCDVDRLTGIEEDLLYDLMTGYGAIGGVFLR